MPLSGKSAMEGPFPAQRLKGLPTEGDEAVAVGEVCEDTDIAEAGFTEKGGSLGSQGFVDFNDSEAIGFEKALGPVRYRTIEDKRIVVGDEEGKVRFMVKDIGAHQGLFLVHDIRRVADENVVPWQSSFTIIGKG